MKRKRAGRRRTETERVEERGRETEEFAKGSTMRKEAEEVNGGRK